jgi:cell division septation protein DedD
VLNFVFWALVGLNGLLLAYSQGYLGQFEGDEREPARMKNQLATERLKLIAPAQAQPGAAGAAPAVPAAPSAPTTTGAPAAPPALAARVALACTVIGNFSAGEARRFEAPLARLDLGERQSRLPVQAQEVTSHLVYLPPQGGKEGADRRAAELRGLGITNFFIMSGETPLKWAISLGVFKTEASARTLLAQLGKQGVQGARVLARGPQVTRFAYQFRGIDAATRARIDGIAAGFPAQQLRSCT